MKANMTKAVTGGIVATAAMSMFMFMGPLMGMPRMNAAAMLAGMMAMPLAAGWIIHFMIGVVFSIIYGRLFIGLLHKINSNAVRGLVYGFIIFIAAQIMMAAMSIVKPMPSAEGNMMLMMVGSLAGHLLFGLVTGIIVTAGKPVVSAA